MDLLKLNRHSGELVYGTNIDGTYLEVRESKHYRWFHFGDDAIQSIIDVKQPEKILLPIQQAMLSFLLWKQAPQSILNLGLGGGVFERHFQSNAEISLETIEISTDVIDVARRYFYLPNNLSIHIEAAESYLQRNHSKVDVILCDIFANQENPVCLKEQTFYQNLQHNCKDSAVVFINLFPINEQYMVELIINIKPYFNHVALIEFENYKNVVLVLSQEVLPTKSTLLERSLQRTNHSEVDFSNVIAGWNTIS